MRVAPPGLPRLEPSTKAAPLSPSRRGPCASPLSSGPREVVCPWDVCGASWDEDTPEIWRSSSMPKARSSLALISRRWTRASLLPSDCMKYTPKHPVKSSQARCTKQLIPGLLQQVLVRLYSCHTDLLVCENDASRASCKEMRSHFWYFKGLMLRV